MRREANRRPAPRPRPLLGVLAALLALASTVPARSEEGVYYSQHRGLEIPFNLDQGEGQVQQVLLHVSVDGGKSYEQVASASSQDRNFRFFARKDGWYWFVVQTHDYDGRFNPLKPAAVPPGLRVCVDTRAPAVALKSVLPRDGTVAVEWSAQDDNLELLTLKLEYRPATGDREWTPLNVRQLAEGQFSWTPTGPGPFEVRLRVSDKAGNVGQGMTTVTPSAPGREGGGTASQAVSAGSAGRGRVIHVKSKTFNLNYKIDPSTMGPSAVKKVEVWATHDDRRSWTKYLDNGPAAGPCKLTVAEEGCYGFTLIPVSGVGLADKAPRPGDHPHIWVQVDEKAPVVKLLDIQVGTGADHGKLTVRWNASDPFLRAQPITLSYALKAEGPWTPLAAKLDNTGVYSGGSDGLPFEFFVKVEAVDEAGNIGSDQTRQTVKVDLKIPKIKEVDVGVSEAPAAAPAAPPAAPPPG